MSAVATGIMRSSLNNDYLSQNSKSSFRTRQLKTSAVVGDIAPTMKSEEMSGEVILEGPGSSTRRYVHIKVYRTSLEHFAVVCPMSKVSRPLGIINLRTAVVERLSSENHPQLAEMKNSPPPRSGFVIRQKVFDTTTCLRIFLSSSDDNFEAWWKAFSTTNAAANGNHRNSPLTTAMQYGSCLPIVVEEEDD